MNNSIYDVIIIGAGWGGICTLKHCLEEKLNVIVLDKNNNYGGIWNIENSPAVYANTYSVTSKNYLSMSDFPIPSSYPEFPHHTLVLEYMYSYIKNFNLHPHIYIGNTVLRLSKSKDNLWVVSYKNGITKNTIFAKNIAICTGQNSRCINVPKIDYSNFKGKVIHANDYDETFMNDYCLNNRVLIYGGSDSAIDIADELTNNIYTKKNNKFGIVGKNNTISKNITKVYLSMHKGRWIQPRSSSGFITNKIDKININSYKTTAADMFYNRTLDSIIKHTSKAIINNTFGKYLERNGKNWHGIKQFETNAGYLNSYYIKSSNLVNKVAIGNVEPLGMIEKINPNTIIAHVNDNLIEIPIDVIIFATGYNGLKCFDEFPPYINTGDYYLHIFLIDDPSIVKVGFIRPYLTSIPMLIEMQSRYIAKVFAKKIFLPNKNIMQEESKQAKHKQSIEFAYDYERVEGIVDPYDYMNAIGAKINAIPSMIKIIFEDYKLFKLAYFGSWSQFFYRLNDPDISKRKIARTSIYELSNYTTSNKIMQIVYNLVIGIIVIIIIIIVVIIYFVIRKKKIII